MKKNIRKLHNMLKKKGDILTRTYLSDDRPTDAVVAEELAMDRSTFYRRKKEAILLCGILLWEEVRERKFA